MQSEGKETFPYQIKKILNRLEQEEKRMLLSKEVRMYMATDTRI